MSFQKEHEFMLDNQELFDRVVRFIIDNVGKTFSANSITNFLKSEHRAVSVETVYNYIHWLKEAFIIYECNRYDIQGKAVLKTQEKYYLSDIHNEPPVHVAIAGDGFTNDMTSGNTMRNSQTAMALRLGNQQLVKNNNCSTLITEYKKDDILIRQYVEYIQGSSFLTMYCEVENIGEDIFLDALPSFNLSCISPFDRFNKTEDIIIHKLISGWSGEGKLYSVSTDRIGFESSWSGLGVRIEKWSQTGTMPARGQLPFVAIEDKANGVCWGATIEAPSSWEIEIVLRNGNICMGGGQSDFLTGHWRKKIAHGQVFRTNKAFITVVAGGLEDACDRLVKKYDYYDHIKPCESQLPVLYNEYCYSWGNPCEKDIKEIIPVASKLGCKYFVIDDGWFFRKIKNGTADIGNWDPNTDKFPNGICSLSDYASSYGMKLGLWYEFEGVSIWSELYKEHQDWLLTSNGKIIQHDARVFLDFRKKEVIDYLREKVIDNLVNNKIGYMKVDYNANVGLGVDGAESLGEGLREHIEAVLSFFEEIKRTLPDLVLEICSSGGMRHEPRFLQLADMVSFSDAHECPSGVNVAFNLHRYMPPRKMQIWATIRDDYSIEDVAFTAAKAMIGRYCLSGNLATKPVEIIDILDKSIKFYEKITHIIANGKTTVIEDSEIKTYLYPQGKTYLIRESLDGKEKLLYYFAIEKPNGNASVEIGDYRVIDGFNMPNDISVNEGKITFTTGNTKMWGCVLHLGKN